MNHSILSLLLLASTAAIAQPTLTGAGINPKMFTTQSFQCASLPVFEIKKTGMNVTWDFNGMPTIDWPYTESNIPFDASVPAYDTLGGTSLVTKKIGVFDVSYTYYIASDTILSIKGATPGTTVYTDAEDIFRFPFSYGDSFVDTSVSIDYGSGSTPQNRRREVIVTTDGYGTLILPNGAIYNDVLRVRRFYTMDVDTAGVPISHTTSNVYEWYQEGTSGPLLTASLDFGANPVHIGTYLTTTTDVSTLEANVQALNIFPNPASQMVTVSFDNIKDLRISITLIDVSGKTVAHLAEKDYYKGTVKETINVSHLARGVYTVRLIAGNSGISKKIAIL